MSEHPCLPPLPVGVSSLVHTLTLSPLTGSELSITEEGIVPLVDERRGIIKTPSEEEETLVATLKKEAYIGLAQALNDDVELEVERTISPGMHPAPCYVKESGQLWSE